MRIAYYFPGQVVSGSYPLVECVGFLEKMGHSVRLVGTSKESWIPERMFTQATMDQVTSVQWWKTFGCDVVCANSLQTHADVLRAARDAGMRCGIDGDSDGLLSPRQWPWKWYARRYRDQRHGLALRARLLKMAWMDWKNGSAIEDALIAQIAACDFLKIESLRAAANITTILKKRGRHDLVGRLRVLPFPVRDECTKVPVSAEREPLVTVMGRLEHEQKDPVLLERSIRAILSAESTVRFAVFSRGHSNRFARLANEYAGSIRYESDASSASVLAHLQHSRILLSTSRLESLPMAGLEAICLGCRLVATPLTGYLTLCDDMEFGTTARNATPTAMRDAFLREWSVWESGQHNPIQSAARARRQFSFEAVLSKFADILAGNPSGVETTLS